MGRQLTLAAALSPSPHRESATAYECMGINETLQMAFKDTSTAQAALLTSSILME